MPIEINDRYTNEVIRTVEADTLRDANLSGADLRGANLSGANLSGADLSDANLRGADMSSANLSVADLRGADLSGADLSDADLSGADLRGANLRDADLPYIPIVEQLDAKILAAIEAGGILEMETWHTCETTHCRYGWAITLAGEAGRVLEGQLGPLTAGALIYWKSAGHIPPYTGDNDAVLADIRARAATT